MVTKLDVLTRDGGLGDVNQDISEIQIQIWDKEIVIFHRKGDGLDFNRGDIRIEIDKKEAIKMARAILFSLNAL